MFLPRNASSLNPGGAAVHASLHTNDYYSAVNEMISWARNPTEAGDVLSYIRTRLLAGPWPP